MQCSTFKYLIFILILFFNILSLILNEKVKMKLTTTLYNYYTISIISFVE